MRGRANGFRGWIAAGAGILALAFGVAARVAADDCDDPVINYSHSAANDPVSRLQQRIDRGEVKLERSTAHGYLESVLRALKISPSSQILVFSKTSFQRDRITPKSPRALYFGDSTYVGWVQGGDVLELATVDPQLGAVFYLLNQHEDGAKFVRQTDECLQCHSSTLTQGVPGFTMRSVTPDAIGVPILPAGTAITTDESPMKERWGGWYVTGTHGAQRHMGNVVAADPSHPEKLNVAAGANVTDLRRRLNIAPYLTRHSDIVALMVAEHQTHVENLITKANYTTRMALNYEEAFNRELKRPAGSHLDSTFSRIRSATEPLVQALLFANEAPLTAPVAGTSGFSAEFPKEGPRDKQGRCLRDFDLRRRLFRYPCSYLIYSEQFDGLPAAAKQEIYRRLWDVLSGKETGKEYAALSAADRKAVLEILSDTKPEFAAARPKA